jgi:hypothetical protein
MGMADPLELTSISDSDKAQVRAAVSIVAPASVGLMVFVVCTVGISQLVGVVAGVLAAYVLAIATVLVMTYVLYLGELGTIREARAEACRKAAIEANRRELELAERERQRQRNAQATAIAAQEERGKIRQSVHDLSNCWDRAAALIQLAKAEFAASSFGSFWDAVERATAEVTNGDRQMRALSAQIREYSRRIADNASSSRMIFPSVDVPPFDELVDELSDIVRAGQSNFQFAVIWEHRRTRATLLDGFATLSDAIYGVETVIRASNRELRLSIEDGNRELLRAATAQQSELMEINANVGKNIAQQISELAKRSRR